MTRKKLAKILEEMSGVEVHELPILDFRGPEHLGVDVLNDHEDTVALEVFDQNPEGAEPLLAFSIKELCEGDIHGDGISIVVPDLANPDPGAEYRLFFFTKAYINLRSR